MIMMTESGEARPVRVYRPIVRDYDEGISMEDYQKAIPAKEYISFNERLAHAASSLLSAGKSAGATIGRAASDLLKRSAPTTAATTPDRESSNVSISREADSGFKSRMASLLASVGTVATNVVFNGTAGLKRNRSREDDIEEEDEDSLDDADNGGASGRGKLRRVGASYEESYRE